MVDRGLLLYHPAGNNNVRRPATYTSFRIDNFRCFPKLALTDLERVNLIAGVNNVGKTAFLEALFLHCGAYNPRLTLNLNAFRGIGGMTVDLRPSAATPWDSLFARFNTSNPVELLGQDEQTGKRLLRLTVVTDPHELAQIAHPPQEDTSRPSQPTLASSEVTQVLKLYYKHRETTATYYLILNPAGIATTPVAPPPPFPTYILPARMSIPAREEAELFGRIDIEGRQDVLLRVLQLLEPRLTRLSMVTAGGEPRLHGDIGVGRLVPLPLMGDGMVRLATLVLRIMNAPNGVVLVDEAENGLHHSIILKVWAAIATVARQFNTQVFATTHSLECIKAAHTAFAQSDKYDFRLHRLERSNETIRAVTYDRDTLTAAIEERFEVR